MKKLFSLLVLAAVVTAASGCANCGTCIKDPPCKPKPACGCAKT